MLIFIFSDSHMVSVFSQLPQQVFVISGSSQDVKSPTLPLSGLHIVFAHHIHIYEFLFGLGLSLTLLHSSLDFIREIGGNF